MFKLLFLKSKLSSDDGLVYEIKSLFRHIVACFILRIKHVRNFNTLLSLSILILSFFLKVNLKEFVSNKLNTILFNHIKNFYEEGDSNKLLKSKMHVALFSRKHEINYLREMCNQLLPIILPDSYNNK